MKKPEMINKQGQRTISEQILKGYRALIWIMVAMAAAAFVFLWAAAAANRISMNYQKERYTAQSVIAAHYKWLEQLSESISTGSEFTGSLDPENCALGSWLKTNGDKLAGDALMAQALTEIIEPHQEIHLTANELIELSRTDREAAYQIYGTDFKPKVEMIDAGLTEISSRYQEITDSMNSFSGVLVIIASIFLAVMTFASVALAKKRAERAALNISEPIRSVEVWLEQLASGVDNMEISEEVVRDNSIPAEVHQMIRSFQKMADSIRMNAYVVRKVAQGDLTGYVELKSSGDSLGKSLYHLVQSNDFMFSNLLNIAANVAESADGIAGASQVLAESSTKQAYAVENLSGMAEQANELAVKNASESADAVRMIGEMKAQIESEEEQIVMLQEAVGGIQEASEKISAVMESLDALAARTNILALNTAVEAARAGAAGRGFAVVAEEVRKLATESKQAAKRSVELIGDTIGRARKGHGISREAAEKFAEIVESAQEISSIMEGINTASGEQQGYMNQIHEEVRTISRVVEDNVAASEETAASSQQMSGNADIIKQEMAKFRLRKREPGKPYIPPEKQQDAEFIQQATANYQMMLQRGGYGSSDDVPAGKES